MTTTGKWHLAKTYRFKRYTTKACKTCRVKPECSKAKYGKAIQRSEYTELINQNKKRIEKKRLLPQKASNCRTSLWHYKTTMGV